MVEAAALQGRVTFRQIADISPCVVEALLLLLGLAVLRCLFLHPIDCLVSLLGKWSMREDLQISFIILLCVVQFP